VCHNLIHSCTTMTDKPPSNFDHSVQRIKQWVSDRPSTATGASPHSASVTSQGAAGASNHVSDPSGGPQLTSGQRKRIKNYLKRCRLNPRHSQLNLEGYLLLPVQRIPRYRLLVRCIYSSRERFSPFYSWKSWRGARPQQKVIWTHLTRPWMKSPPSRRT
jgi:hypothetical protein